MSKSNQIVLDLLSRAQGDQTSVVFSEAIVHKPLILRPTTSIDQTSDARAIRQRARAARAAEAVRKNRKPRPLSAKEKRELGLHHIPEAQQRWDIFEPLHRLWLGYIREVLGLKGREADLVFVDAKGTGPLLAAADLHGAKVTVVKCRCVGRVGVTGIVAKETKNTFEILTRRNELKVIPKEYTVIEVKIPIDDSDTSKEIIFELHGSSFAHRPAERITRKPKFHFPKDA